MILVDCKKVKEVLIPSPLKCLEVSKLTCNVFLRITSSEVGNKKWQTDLCTLNLNNSKFSTLLIKSTDFIFEGTGEFVN